MQVLLDALEILERDAIDITNGHPEGDELKNRLTEAIGEVMGTKVFEIGRSSLVSAVLEKDIAI